VELMSRLISLRNICLVLLCAGCGTPHTSTADLTGAVASPEPYAAKAGERVLLDGGNAVDAAVCMGFVLAVTHPPAGNLGGGGFIVVHTADGDALVVDARETAPRAARRDMYLDRRGRPRPDASLVGPLAAGVPGSVAGYLMLHERYGTLPRRRLLEPAIHLAEKGFRVDAGLSASLERSKDLLRKFPETAAIFLPGGDVPRGGDKLRQPALAKVLHAISEKGLQGFYRGWFAQEVQDTCAKYGGVLTIGDFYTYRAKERQPLRGTYRGYEIVTMPPPSSGGVCLLQMLDLLERGEHGGLRHEQRLHLFAEAGRRAFADRARYFGDPDFTDVPVAQLLDEDYLARRFATIRMDRATPSDQVQGGLRALAARGRREREETCHFSVVDDAGNAVSCTTTLNGAYGCGLAVSGVLLNNEMDDFTVKPGVPNQFGLIQGEKNAIAPAKRPLSSMTPTILLKDGRPHLVLGSPGGPTIISTVCQVIYNHVAAGMSVKDAVAAARIHQQWMPDEVLFERLTPHERRSLEALGHRLRQRQRPMGDVQAVSYNRLGRPTGVSDPRGRGAASK
jgi:gamma-glutamyltranspeptidase/glutathione hydrolase